MGRKSQKVSENKSVYNNSIEKEVLENRESIDTDNVELDVINPKKKLFKNKLNNLKVKYKKDKKKFLVMLSSLIFVLSLICGSSYALYTAISKTDNTTLIEAGTLALTLKNEANVISLNGAVPQEDSDALENNSEYEFQIENTGSLNTNYVIRLDNTCNLNKTYEMNGEVITPDKCIPNEYIKVGLKKGDEEYKVLEYDEEKNEYVLEQNILKSKEVNEYKMKVWLSYDTPNEYNSQNIYNIIYSGKLSIDYEQTTYEKKEVAYKVSYNANGGTGEMSDQSFAKGEEKTLSKNTFTKEGSSFIGWGTSEDSDTVKYSDEEKVSNLTDVENEIIKLYAVWGTDTQKIEVTVKTGTSTKLEKEVKYGGNVEFNLSSEGYNSPVVTCTEGITGSIEDNVLKITNVISDGECEIQYTANTYIIGYTLDGGTSGSSAPTSATYDKEVTISNPSKTGYTFTGWTSTSINEKTAYYGTTKWEDRNVKTKSTTFKNLTSENSGKVTLIANWEANTYKVTYDANGGIGEMEDSIYTYGTANTLTKNIYTKVGYDFLGWSKDKDAVSATYKDEENVKNLTSVNGETITLYAIWTLKEKQITINMTYDTSTFSGPSSVYQTSEYQYLSKTSTKLKYGEEETITSSPAYPDDRYTGSVSCTDGIEANLTEGEGTTSRTDSITITNNTPTTTAGTCTITYTPKWEGIEAGTYSGTTTYAGSTWTVKADNGDNVGLALNGNAGSGSYKTDVQGDLANTAVNTDVTGGGIVGQSSGVYVSTDSDINTNYDSVGQVYWSGSGKVITNEAVTKYTLGTVVTYSSGHRSYNTNTGSGTATYWSSIPFSTSYSSEPLYDAGVSISVSDDNSTVLFSDAVLSSSNQGYMSDRYTNFDPDNTTAASSAKLPMRPAVYSGLDDSLLGSNYITNTKTWKLYDCGNSYHGQAYTFTAVDSTQYKYISQTGSSLTPAYSSYWTFYWAGGSVASTTTGTANSNLVRTYRFDQGGNCLERTKYTTSDVEKDIYYRPYLIVRER